jgi:hypothetical protein
MMKHWILVILLGLFSGSHAFAADGADDLSQDDTYDPFADYSEFEASADEEADINFFKNGRFFNLAFLFGPRMFTGNLGKLAQTAPEFGVYIAYFFDIRTALQISYLHGDHTFHVPAGTYDGDSFKDINGNLGMSTFNINMKYYFNTQNITRGFADLNPYIIGGFSINYRTINVTDENVLAKSNPTGIEIGGGLEVPIARNKMYLGVQAMYHYVTFPDEGSMIFQDKTPTGWKPAGDYADLLFVLGINF